MITCICVDDEPKALDVIRIHARKVPQLQVLEYFTNPFLAKEYLMDHPIDFILLDINMPGLSGLQILDQLSYRPMVIFTTAYSEYAVDSYDYQAVDYLLKPIVFNRFNRALSRVEDQLRNKRQEQPLCDFLFLKDGYRQVKVQIGSILYVQSDGNYLDVHTEQDKIVTRMSFRDLCSRLPPTFIRIHNSYLINMEKIDSVEDNQVFINTAKLPVGPNYRKAVLERLGI